MGAHSGFGELAPLYRAKGLWPRPVAPGSKMCPIQKWQRPDPEIPSGELANWLERYRTFGTGLVMGSPLPDGTNIVALDIDRDDYIRVARALVRDPVCERIGSKGAAIFARLRGDARYREFKAKALGDRPAFKIGELLGDRRLCVLPPTIHPSTGRPYVWVGKSLLDIELTELPLIEA